MDHIIQCIYKSCDREDNNCVSVSSLIDFIKPYMPNNLSELIELQNKLDPDNTNPCIDGQFFQRIMNNWISNIQKDEVNNSFSEFSVNLGVNVSQIASGSKSNSNNNNKSNENPLDEQVRNLEHQLSKTTAELELVKQQLNAYEDQNESLLAELNAFHKSQLKGQHTEECLHKDEYDSDDADHEAKVVNKKNEQLKKMLSVNEKQQQMQLAQINQLEMENFQLKKKILTFEKVKREDKKSLSEFQDCLDIKEGEISTLTEALNSLKHDLEEKNDLLSFYANEHKFLKQKVRDLEGLLQKNSSVKYTPQNKELNDSSFIFNTPRLLNQLSKPISPLFNLKECNTSSPIKNSPNCGASCSDLDIFSNTEAVSFLRSPHKTLKEELSELSSEKINDLEVERLYKIVKQQEDIKNNLWQNLKQMSIDCEELLYYKNEYLDLVNIVQEKDALIESLKNQMDVLGKKEENGNSVQQCENVGKSNVLSCLMIELTNVESNLREQKLMDCDLQKKLKSFSHSLKRKIKSHDAIIQNMTSQLNISVLNGQKQETINTSLCQKTVADKSTETGTEVCIWNVKPVFSEQPEQKRTTYAKQQIRLERLSEMQETLQKDLANEKSINTKFSVKFRETCDEMAKIKEELNFCRNKILKQAECLNEFNSSQEKFKHEVDSLMQDKNKLKQDLSNALNRLTVETMITNNLRTENKVLYNRQFQLEMKIKSELSQQVALKTQLLELKTLHNLSIRQLQDELTQKKNEINNLKKQQLESESMELSLAEFNGKLKSAILNFNDLVKFYDDTVQELFSEQSLIINEEFTCGLEFQMAILYKYIEIVVLLIQSVSQKHVDLIKRVAEAEERLEIFYDESEEIVTSCSTENFLAHEETSNAVSWEYDSFLDELKLEDSRHLSLQDLEEKFASIALILTVDVATAKKRSTSEEEKLSRLTLNFFLYLNNSIGLMRRLNARLEKSKIHKNTLTYLLFLKDISKDLLKSAIGLGVRHYEERTANCWKLVIEYVAALGQENKQMKQNCGLEIQLVSSAQNGQSNRISEKFQLTSLIFGSTFFRRVKRFIYLLFLFLFIFVIALIFYVDQLCPKNGKRMCPLQWIINLFIEKTYSDDFHL